MSQLAVSPDGKSVFYCITASDLPRGKRVTQVWIMDADGSNARQLTSGDKGANSPAFSPDGKWISFGGGGPPWGTEQFLRNSVFDPETCNLRQQASTDSADKTK